MTLSVLTIIIGLVAQQVFISQLGSVYLGVNGLLTSIVSILALAELGLGAAIYFNLYKPVADNDKDKIKAILKFYRRGYFYISLLIASASIVLLPLVHKLTSSSGIDSNVTIIYSLFIAEVLFSYMVTYKKSLLFVDQNNHIISLVHIAYLILLNASQIIFLILTKNYYVYLVCRVVFRLLENVVLDFITTKKYPYLKEKDSGEIDPKTKRDIIKKLKALSFHKIGAYIVVGSDNIIISTYFGIATVGLYSSYLLVTNAVNMIINQAFTAITASVGNLLVTESHQKSYAVYRKIRFANFWLSTFATTSFLVMMNSFVSIWIGEDFLLEELVLLFIGLNLYSTLMRGAMSSFKEAAGLFHDDRFVPIFEAIINIVASILFLKLFGLAGVFMGTLTSTLILHLYSYPKFVYVKIFKKTLSAYFKELGGYVFVSSIVIVASYVISREITSANSLINFMLKIAFVVSVPNLVMYILYRKTEEFTYYKNLLCAGIKKVRNIGK